MDLACERCGGPLPERAASEVVTCGFCGGTAAPAPRVIERVVERAVVVEAAPGSQLHCPRCGGELKKVRPGVLFVCSPCGGAFVNKSTVERLTRERDDDLVNAARRAVGAFAPRDQDRRPMLGCPFCAAPLERRPIGHGFESYDVCAAHGAFFADRSRPLCGRDTIVSARLRRALRPGTTSYARS